MRSKVASYVSAVMLWTEVLSATHFHRSSLSSPWRVPTADRIFPMRKYICSAASCLVIPAAFNRDTEKLKSDSVAGAITAIVDNFVHGEDRGTKLGTKNEAFEFSPPPNDQSDGAIRVARSALDDFKIYDADYLENPKLDEMYERNIPSADQDCDTLHQAASSLYGRSCESNVDVAEKSYDIYNIACLLQKDKCGLDSRLEEVNDDTDYETALVREMYTAVTSSKLNTDARRTSIHTRTRLNSPNVPQSSAGAMSVVLASAASAASAAAAAAAIAAKVSDDISLQESKRSIIVPAINKKMRGSEKRRATLSNQLKEAKLDVGINNEYDILSPKDVIPAHHVLFRTSRRDYRIATTHTVLTILAAQSFKTFAAHILHSGNSAGAMGWLRLGFASAALEATHLVCLARSPRLKAALTTASAPSLTNADYAFVIKTGNVASRNTLYSRLWPWLTRRSEILTSVGTLVPILHGNVSTDESNRTAMSYRNSKWEYHSGTPDSGFVLHNAANSSSASERTYWRRVTPPCCMPLEWYAATNGHSESSAAIARVRYGENRIDLGAVSLLHLFGARLASPLALWQVVSCLLSIADGYGANSISYLVMFGLTELNVAFQEYMRKRTLRKDLSADGGTSPRHLGGSNKGSSGDRETAEHVLVWRSKYASTANLDANHEASNNKIQDAGDAGVWVAIPMTQLVPGDLMALRASNNARTSDASGDSLPETRIVPADLLVLSGEATVDEATLTGEDAPQTKVAVAPRQPSALPAAGASIEGDPSHVKSPRLDIADAHRRHVLFAGTKLLSHAAGKASEMKDQAVDASNACVCYVLRTGWDSTRGELVRLATRDKEGSDDDEDDSSSGAGARGLASVRAESTKLLTFLLSVGVATAVTVLVQPAADVNPGSSATDASSTPADGVSSPPAVASLVTVTASEFRALTKRLLRASRVLMSVVPTDLDSASSLTFARFARELKQRFGIVSNDDWRLPLAGRTTTAVFDKTGTLTVDRISFEGVRRPSDEETIGGKSAGKKSTSEVDGLALAVLAGCHALVLDPEASATSNNPLEPPDNNKAPQPLLGDSLEAAALHALGWQLDANMKDTVVPLPAKENGREPVVSAAASSARDDAMRSTPLRSIAILKRYPFDAATRRMGVVARVAFVAREHSRAERSTTEGNSTSSSTGEVIREEVWFLVKGAAEAVRPLLATTRPKNQAATHESRDAYGDDNLPWLDHEAATCAQAGARVLALAGRRLSFDDQARANVLPSSNGSESDNDGEVSLDELAFSSDGAGLALGGLALFRAEIRKDAASAVKALRNAGVGVVMLTGDAVGTAAQVGLHVGLGLPSTTFTSHTRNQIGDSEDSCSNHGIGEDSLEESQEKEPKEVNEIKDESDDIFQVEATDDEEEEDSNVEEALLAALAYVDARLNGHNGDSCTLLERVNEAATAANTSTAASELINVDRRRHQLQLLGRKTKHAAVVKDDSDRRRVLELRPNATATGALLGLGATHPDGNRFNDTDLATLLWWHDLRSGAAIEPFAFTRLPELAAHNLLCCGGPTLDRLLLQPSREKLRSGDLRQDLRAALPYFSILTRATPDAKEKTILALQSFPPPTVLGSSHQPHHNKKSKAEVLFCGDGGNDLGGLHVASTGVAVVAMSSTTAPTQASSVATTIAGSAGMKGSSGGSSLDTPTNSGGGGGVAGSSLAAVAPFAADASRRCVAGVASVVGVGRCAQAHMVSNHASSAVDALLSAAALCELYHSHKRWGDRQLLCLQGFSAVLALVFANAAMPRTTYTGEGTSIPCGTRSSASKQERGVKEHYQGIQGEDSGVTLGPVTPLPSLFTPAAAVSVLGQAAIHVLLMRTGAALGRKWDNRAAQALVTATMTSAGAVAAPPPVSALERVKSALKRPPFVPNHVANHLFLLNAAQAVAVPLTNFAGRPFTLDVTSSLPLLAATVGGVVVIIALAAGVVPPLEALLQWAPLQEQRPFSSTSLAEGQPILGGNPQAAQRTALALGTLILPWLWRRLTEEFLAPSIARARANTPLSEASQQNFGKVATGVVAALALLGPALLESAAQSASSLCKN